MRQQHSYLAKFLGTYIFEKRRDLGVTQSELAKLLGFTAQFLGHIEKGFVMIPEGALINAINILSLDHKKILNIYRLAGDLGGKEILEAAQKAASHKRKRSARS